jgi:hypothetical protein
LIFDEIEEAEKILANKEMNYFKQEDMTILAKYFRRAGQSWPEVKKSLIEVCNSQEESNFQGNDEYILDNAIQSAKKYYLRIPKPCVITKDELAEIETLNDFKVERIFFVMICLAKYFMETNTAVKKKEYDNPKLIFWKTTMELFKEARYSDNFFDRNILIGEIEDRKYIKTEPNKNRTKNHIIINTFYPESEPVIFFDNPDKIYKLYEAYKDNKLLKCEVCGISDIKNSNRQTMCKRCSEEIGREKTRERVRRHRCKV